MRGMGWADNINDDGEPIIKCFEMFSSLCHKKREDEKRLFVPKQATRE
jgi:hypothetical protein